MTDARLLDGKLYILSQVDINRRYLYDNQNFTSSDITPKAIDIDAKDNSVSIIEPDCNKISYLFPSDDTIDEFGLYPTFTLVTVIDTENQSKDPETNVIVSQAGQIHMSQESLYLVQNVRVPQRRECPMGAKCIMPRFDNGQYSLIHKFSLDSMNVEYQNSNVVPGSLLTQYSMDEDSAGNFRILTTKNRSE